ncbi:Mov34/MPN/PAD-1 family protein [Pantoea ananatis]
MRKKINGGLTSQSMWPLRYPKEACGLVVQAGGNQIGVPCKNISDNPTEHFAISPEEKRDAEKQGAVLMVIHSHPDVLQL